MNDPLDLVRRHRPGVDWEWSSTERGQQVMRRAMDLGALEARSPSIRPRRHSRGAIAAAIAGGAAVVTLGAFVFNAQFEPRIPSQAGCYERLDPKANITEASDRDVASVGAVKACAITWRAGHDTPVDTSHPVACVNPSGYRGIFPAPLGMTAEEACASIGWQVEQF